MSVAIQFIPWVKTIVDERVGVGLAYSLLKDIDRAEDVIQTALVKLVGLNIDTWNGFESEENGQNYFKRIIRNLVREATRRNRFRTNRDDVSEPIVWATVNAVTIFTRSRNRHTTISDNKNRM